MPYATGFAFGLVLQAVEVSVGVGLGLVCLAREGLSFAVLRRMGEEDETPPRTWSRRFASSWRSSTRTRLLVRALLCPASLKGVLSAREAAAALARGVRASGGKAVELPVADGGEGTGEALESALGGAWHSEVVSDPLGRPVPAAWLLLPDGRAVVEAAAAIGLPRLGPDERDPLVASSRGFGELVLAALRASPAALLVGLGGSATVDGGAGLREVVRELPVPTTVLCDVRTTLGDAARLFGPQKGASVEGVRDARAAARGDDRARPFAELPGSGAAGGLGAALAALGAELVPGAETVLDLVGFDSVARGCDLVVTGEGRIDDTTREGKAPGEIAASVRGGRRPLRRLRRSRPRRGGRGAETVALSGDPSRAEADLVELGATAGSRVAD